jgi:hypothetical protein
LPTGRLECVAVCDGYLSANPLGGPTTFVMPHKFDVPTTEEIVIPMREAAVANIRVIGPKDEPLAGASIHFWPNIQWGGQWSTIFASDFYREMEGLEQKVPGEWQKRTPKRTYSVKTGEDGRAVVRELPPGMLPFTVEHPDLELPLYNDRREISMALVGGETNFATAKLERKGKQFRD